MSFGKPQLWWLLFVGPGLVVFYLWAFRAREAAISRFIGRAARERLVRGVSPGRLRLKAALLVVAAFAAAFACLEPRWGYHWEEVRSRGQDILFALDVSKSMLAEDVSPSRLERAKRKILDFLEIAEGDRVGILAFAGKSFIACPLTLDYSALPVFLASLSPDSVSVPGTNLGDAADRAFKDADEKDRKGHALVILSDGENLEGNPLEAARRAKERGVRIYAIGVGKDSGAPIPLPEGGGFKKDSKGDLILTRLDEHGLQEIALATGGSYVRSVASDADLKQIYADIHRTGEEKESTGGRRKKENERYAWPLLLAVGLLAWEMGLPEGAAQVLVLAVLLVSGAAQAAPPISETLAGQKAYREGKYDEAIEHFLNAQVDDPGNPKLRYDLGNAYYKAGKYPEAEKQFQAASREADPQLQEQSLYNLGNTAFREQKLEDAIKAYEGALEKSPNDPDAKYNLEVAKRQQQQQKQQQQQQQKQKQKQDPKNQQQKNQQNQDQQQKQDQKATQQQQQQKQSAKQNEKPQQSQGQQGQKEKAEEKPSAQQQKQQPPQQGQAAQEAQAPKPGEMSKEEAEQWLSRLSEERKADRKRKQGNTTYDVDKDW